LFEGNKKGKKKSKSEEKKGRRRLEREKLNDKQDASTYNSGSSGDKKKVQRRMLDRKIPWQSQRSGRYPPKGAS